MADRLDSKPAISTVLTIADQACSSGSNFALLLLVAQTAPTADFGRFAILFGVLSIGLAVSRSALGVPLALDWVKQGQPVWKDHLRASTAMALLLGCSLLLIEMLVALALNSTPFVHMALVLAVASPIVITQDLWRVAAVAKGVPARALVADAAWLTISGAAVLFNILGPGDLEPRNGLLIWGAGALLAGAVLAGAREGVLPRLSGLTEILRESRRMHLSLDSLLASSCPVIVAATVSMTIDAVAVGAVRGATSLMSPLNVLLAAVPLGLIPFAARREPEAARKLVVRVTFVIGALAASVAGLLTLFPEAWGNALLGETWTAARPLIGYAGVEYVGIAAWTGAATLLRLTGRTHTALNLRIGYAAGTVISVLLVTHLIPKAAAASATSAIAAVTTALAGWLVVQRTPVKSTKTPLRSPHDQ